MRIIPIVAVLALISSVSYAQQEAAPAPATKTPVHRAASTRLAAPITRDQFLQMAQARSAKTFDKMDANHDGTVDAKELAAYRAQQQAAHVKHASTTKKPAKTAPSNPA